MNVQLLTKHHLEFFSLKAGCIASSESTLVEMPHYWKSHVMAQLLLYQPYGIAAHVRLKKDFAHVQ